MLLIRHSFEKPGRTRTNVTVPEASRSSVASMNRAACQTGFELHRGQQESVAASEELGEQVDTRGVRHMRGV